MSGTSLHVGINAIVDTFTAAGIAKLTVCDGQDWDPGTLALEVAWAGEDRDAVEIQRAPTNAAMMGGIERVTVWCLLSNHRGSGAVAAARAELVDTFTQLVATLEADPTLGDVVAAAQVGDLRYTPQRVEGGPMAMVAFPVEYTAFP